MAVGSPCPHPGFLCRYVSPSPPALLPNKFGQRGDESLCEKDTQFPATLKPKSVKVLYEFVCDRCRTERRNVEPDDTRIGPEPRLLPLCVAACVLFDVFYGGSVAD